MKQRPAAKPLTPEERKGAFARAGLSRMHFGTDAFARRSTQRGQLEPSRPVFRVTWPRIVCGWLANALCGL